MDDRAIERGGGVIEYEHWCERCGARFTTFFAQTLASLTPAAGTPKRGKKATKPRKTARKAAKKTPKKR